MSGLTGTVQYGENAQKAISLHSEKQVNETLLSLTSQIVSAYVINHKVDVNELAALMTSVHQQLMALEKVNQTHDQQGLNEPTKQSITQDYLICLEDGKKLKMLKRHLRTNYNMTPQEYRAKWGLPSDYPMVAPSYAAKRSEYAKSFGLGRSNSKTPKNES